MLTLDDIEEVKLRPSIPERDDKLPTYDNTRLVAINTCPTWGIVRYGKHKQMPGTSRAMALEAGSACHDVFAAARVYQLREIDGLPDHADYHGQRIFGKDRYFEHMLPHLHTTEGENTQMMNFCIEALYTSGFYDDPNDQRRTLAALEDSCMAYLDRLNFRNPIWVSDPDVPSARVGIEIAFDIRIKFVPKEGTIWDVQHPVWPIRFTGRIDGVHVHDGKLRIHENKTGARINDAWAESMIMTSQVTGYVIALSTLCGVQVEDAATHGLAIPLPKMIDYGGVLTTVVHRGENQIHEWFEWLLHTVQLENMWKDDPVNAPKYTHSCNRYFRSCSLLPFCASSPDERKNMLEEMEHAEWSPLHEVQGS